MANKRVIYEMSEEYLTRLINAVCWRHNKDDDSDLTDGLHAREMVAQMLHKLVLKHDIYLAKQEIPQNINDINITVETV